MYKRILVSREEIKKTRTERETSMKESGGGGRGGRGKRKEKKKMETWRLGKLTLLLEAGGSLKYSFNLVRKNYIIKWPI